MTTLTYCLNDAFDVAEYRKPSEVLKELGIVWKTWESQPIADQIKLSGCENVPEKLPPFIVRRTLDA